MTYTNPAVEIYGKIDEYVKNISNKDIKESPVSKKGLLRSTKNMKDKDKMSDTPLARVAKYVKTIRQEREKLNGNE